MLLRNPTLLLGPDRRHEYGSSLQFLLRVVSLRQQVLFLLVLGPELFLQFGILVDELLQLRLLDCKLFLDDDNFLFCSFQGFSLGGDLLVDFVEFDNCGYPLADAFSCLRRLSNFLGYEVFVYEVRCDLLYNFRVDVLFRIVFQLVDQLLIVAYNLL